MQNLENQEVQMAENKSIKAFNTVSKILMIVSLIAYLVITVILTYSLIDTLMIADANKRGLSLALFLIVGVIVVGGIGYLAVLIISIIGLVLTCVNLKNGAKRINLAYFIVAISLSVLTELAFVLVCSLA